MRATLSEPTSTYAFDLAPHTKPIQTLAQAYGIATSYTDVFGNAVTVPVDTLATLLAAFGVSLTSSDDVAKALTQLPALGWEAPLPPVLIVVPEREPGTLNLHWPCKADEPLLSMSLPYTLVLEGGNALSGMLTFHPTGERLETETFSGMPLARFTAQLSKATLAPNRPQDLPLGYHTLTIALPDQRQQTLSLIFCPPACYQGVPEVEQGRVWGLATQLYAQRSAKNWGMGDYADLADMCRVAGQAGASLVGLNPIHGLFPERPEHTSPYSPSSRRLFQHGYLRIEAIPEFVDSSAAQALVTKNAEAIAQWRSADVVQYGPILSLKQQCLQALFDTLKAYPENHPRKQAFNAYRVALSPTQQRLAIFQARSADQNAQAGHITCWWDWPQALQEVSHPQLQSFADANADAVAFFHYVQWCVQQQLDHANTAASESGLTVGLYGDLAVGSDSSGADVWLEQDLYVRNVQVGCPPDECNLLGQNWGLPPQHPKVLRQMAYKPFIELLQANMAVYGAIRIDHAMCLYRLFWIPQGKSGAEGTYVHYPVDDLFALVALESQRNQCMVIGEDLGTVPPAIGEAFDRWQVHSYRLFFFERQDNGYKPPEVYPRQALTALTTHDLPTLWGFWSGDDIETRNNLGLYPTPEFYQRQWDARPQEKQALITALHHAGLWGDMQVPAECSLSLVRAVQQFLAKTPSRLLVCQLEDIFAQVAQVNLPGTVNEHPNWQIRLNTPIEAWSAHPSFASVCEGLAHERPRHV